VGAIVFGSVYIIGLILIIIEAGVVTSPPVLSHSPSLATASPLFNTTGDFQLTVSIILTIGLLCCSYMLWQARRRMIKYVRESPMLKNAPLSHGHGNNNNGNKVGIANSSDATSNSSSAVQVVQSVGQRKFAALLERLQVSSFVLLFTPPLAASILLRDILWFNYLVPIAGGSEVTIPLLSSSWASFC
jgi:hypothetical protein